MKILYVTFLKEEKKEDVGVLNKVKKQSKSFEKFGFETTLAYCENNFFIIDKEKIRYNYNNIFEKMKGKITLNKKIRIFLLKQDFDILYIRKPNINKGLLSFFEKVKEKNKIIVLEIPTYPYDDEIENFFIKQFFKIEKWYRNNLYKYIDLITYYGDYYKTIFNCKCLLLQNGIDLDTINLKTKFTNKNKKINLIGVANLSKWHGYDIMIKSINEYNKTKNKTKIIFNIVGDGKEKQKLFELVKLLNLQKNIVFYGVKKGQELDELFNEMDLAVSSLGLFRINLDKITPLKPAEYCARGIPFILGNTDSRFNSKDKFIYRVENNEKLIDLEKVVRWLENLKFNPCEIRKRSISFTWDVQVKLVINKINEIKSIEN
jgi:glycosyltransferase involved in cell wall biosynthesis